MWQVWQVETTGLTVEGQRRLLGEGGVLPLV